MFWRKQQSWYEQHLNANIKAITAGDYSRIPQAFCVFAGAQPGYDIYKHMVFPFQQVL